jgi:hypothetical protein
MNSNYNYYKSARLAISNCKQKQLELTCPKKIFGGSLALSEGIAPVEADGATVAIRMAFPSRTICSSENLRLSTAIQPLPPLPAPQALPPPLA